MSDRQAASGAPEGLLTPERKRAILEERARRLAAVPTAAAAAAGTEALEVLTFRLGGETFALETRYVRRVEGWHPPTPVPGSPAILAGVVPAAGEILAIFDVRIPFGLEPAVPTDRSRIVVLGEGRDEFGVIADEALEVSTLPVATLHEPSGTSATDGRGFVRGVTGDALVVLDGRALLADERLVVEQSDDPATGDERGQHGG